MGVAKRRLVGHPRDGELWYLGRQVGWVVRGTWKRPIYASPGHMVSMESSLRVVLMFRESRIPEPIRLAHRLSRWG